MQRLLLVGVLAACGSSTGAPPVDPTSDPTTVAKPAADPAPCEDASTNAVKFIDKDLPADQVKAMMSRHCIDDKWTIDTRKCMLTAKSLEELDGCAKTLTPDQESAFKQDLEKFDPGEGSARIGTPAPPQNTSPSQIPPPAGSMPK